jgi:hypothetical protein
MKQKLRHKARYPGGELGLPMIDETGGDGRYDFELSWNPHDGKPRAETSSRPSRVTAVREQLGLTLKRGSGQVEAVVVDYAEKASANKLQFSGCVRQMRQARGRLRGHSGEQALRLSSRLIPHRHGPRTELQPAHEPQIDTLR